MLKLVSERVNVISKHKSVLMLVRDLVSFVESLNMPESLSGEENNISEVILVIC